MGRNQCVYCSNDLTEKQWSSKWDQEYHEEHHYKIVQCDCGKKNWLKTNFHGSGHDTNIIRKEDDESTLDSTIKKVFEKDYWR